MGLDKYVTSEDFSSEYRKDQEEAILLYGGKLAISQNTKTTLIGDRGVRKMKRYDYLRKMNGTNENKSGGDGRNNTKLLMLKQAQKERSPTSRPTKMLKSGTVRKEKVPFMKKLNVGKERVTKLLRNTIVMGLKDYAAVESSKEGLTFSFEAFAKKFERLEFETKSSNNNTHTYRVVHARRTFWCGAYTDLLLSHFDWSRFLYLDSELNKYITTRDAHMRDCARKIVATPLQKQFDELVYKNLDSQVRKLGRYIVEQLNVVTNIVKTIAYFDINKHPDSSPDVVLETILMAEELLDLEGGYKDLDIEKAYSYLRLYNDMCLQSKDLGEMVSRVNRSHVSKKMAEKMDIFVKSFQGEETHGRYIWDERTVAKIRSLTETAVREPMTKILAANILTMVRELQSRLLGDAYHLAIENPQEMTTYLKDPISNFGKPYTFIVTQDDIAAFDGRIYKKKMITDPNYALAIQTHKLLRQERELFQTYWACRSSAAEFAIYTEQYFKQAVDNSEQKEQKPTKFGSRDGKSRKGSDNDTGNSNSKESLYFNADGTFDTDRFDTVSKTKNNNGIVDDDTIAIVSEKLRASLETATTTGVAPNSMNVEEDDEDEAKSLSMSEILKAATESWVDATTVHSMVRSTIRNIIPLACDSLGLIKFEYKNDGGMNVILKEFSTEDRQRGTTTHTIDMKDVEKMNTAMYEFITMGVKGVFSAMTLYGTTLTDEIERREEKEKENKKKESEAQSGLWKMFNTVRDAAFGEAITPSKKLTKIKQRLKDDVAAFEVYNASFVSVPSVLEGEVDENFIQEHLRYYAGKNGNPEVDVVVDDYDAAMEDEDEKEKSDTESHEQPKTEIRVNLPSIVDNVQVSQKETNENTQPSTKTPITDTSNINSNMTPTPSTSTDSNVNTNKDVNVTTHVKMREKKDVEQTTKKSSGILWYVKGVAILITLGVIIYPMYQCIVSSDYFESTQSSIDILTTAFNTFVASSYETLMTTISSITNATSDTLTVCDHIRDEVITFTSAQRRGSTSHTFAKLTKNIGKWIARYPRFYRGGAATLMLLVCFVQRLTSWLTADTITNGTETNDVHSGDGGDDGTPRLAKDANDNASSSGYARWIPALLSKISKFENYILPAFVTICAGSNMYHGAAAFAASALFAYFVGPSMTAIMNRVKKLTMPAKTGFKLAMLLTSLFFCYNPYGSLMAVSILASMGFLLSLIVNKVKNILRFYRVCATFGLMCMFLDGYWTSALATAAVYGSEQLLGFLNDGLNSKRPRGSGDGSSQPRKVRRTTEQSTSSTTSETDNNNETPKSDWPVKPTTLLAILYTLISIVNVMIDPSATPAANVENDSTSGNGILSYYVNPSLMHLYTATYNVVF